MQQFGKKGPLVIKCKDSLKKSEKFLYIWKQFLKLLFNKKPLLHAHPTFEKNY
jgi:hypothetical protein